MAGGRPDAVLAFGMPRAAPAPWPSLTSWIATAIAMATATAMNSSTPEAPLCSEEEITQLVHAFYARVRQDEQLGPIFNAHVDDWDHHLAKLVDFWSSILLRTGRYSGTPMPKHAALPGLNADLFHRWLALFRQTASEQPNRAMAERACTMAERIAQSLWMGYQMVRCPDTIASPLPYA